MADPAAPRPRVIIIYKKTKHDYFHGGAWKVAFADFMTAMFALFLTLWILTQSVEVKSAIASYFRHPTDYEGRPDIMTKGNPGLFNYAQGRMDAQPFYGDPMSAAPAASKEKSKSSAQTPESAAGGAGSEATADAGARPTDDVETPPEETFDELHTFLKISDDLWHRLGMKRKYKDNVRIATSEEGMLIQLVTQPDSPLLNPSGELTDPIKEALSVLGQGLATRPNNKLEVSGHNTNISQAKWVATATLADMARAELEHGGLRPGQISRVCGCADSQPLNKGDAHDPLNQRISILVHPQQWRPESW